MRKNPSYTALLGPTRLLISEKSATYTIKWSYTIIWQVRVVSNIINKEGYWKPKKLPGSPQKATKKNSGQKSRNIFVGILDETDFPKDILKLTDLYHLAQAKDT